MTRSRSRRMASLAALPPSLPEEVLVWEIFVRLPAKDILRCRLVCRAWRRLTSSADFLLAHHQRQPSLPILTLYSSGSTEGGGLPILKRGRPLLGFDDYDHFAIHASCDGLLLVSLCGHRFTICNPATRQWARVPFLDDHDIEIIAALYLHFPSGEYRVLYWKDNHLKDAYYIHTIGSGGSSARCIGVPSDIPGRKKVLSTCNELTTTMFQNCLHWDPSCFRGNADIVVFDTVVESFRFMRSPAGATRLCTSLYNMEGLLSFSCFDDDKTSANIWVLEDYQREVWSFKYRVKLPVESLRNLEYRWHFVMSQNGDVLVNGHSKGYMIHCDNNGKVLEEFHCDPWSLDIIGHKESLIKHNFFLGRGESGYALGYERPPSLFHRL